MPDSKRTRSYGLSGPVLTLGGHPPFRTTRQDDLVHRSREAGEPSIEAPIIQLEATSRAAERRRRAIPAQSRGEAREALRASERTQSNEVWPPPSTG